MRWLLVAAMVTLLSTAASAQSGYNSSMWCAAWAPQTWDSTNGYKFCRDGGLRPRQLIKTRSAAKVIHGPYFVSPERLAFECFGVSSYGCATRLRPGHCSIYVNNTLAPSVRKIVLAEERKHCAGYTHG